ncbi:NERD domain-containing protein [Bacillus solimangrovi]|uniref:NERD domain-containing protein n=1 Tax=Bacillus solimangrovi TaxID=1305675 RepID=A0A1E5LCI4_9BACI|nr:NERD domain-containing protein [Bacillus solimangrovi]OEH91771.1 hypothetical protein BFG57_03250 [Bacillus solimangrovi]
MAQLIKLQDFISRYETDIYRYPSQYIRLKKHRWEGIKKQWYNGTLSKVNFSDMPNEFSEYKPNFEEDWLNDNRKSFFSSMKNWFARNKNKDENYYYENEIYSVESQHQAIERHKSLDEVKQDFLDELLRFQIMWASSTIRDKSYVNHSLYYDTSLRYFLQQFPDNFLILYQPIFQIKSAPVELDIVMLTPISTICITLLESQTKEGEVFQVDKGRYWIEGYGEESKKRINPMLTLNRMYKVINGIYEHEHIDMPVKRIVLSRNGYIEQAHAPADTQIIDRRTYKDWHDSMKRMPSPLKHNQLKAAQSLLNYCQSTYVRRSEWEESDDLNQGESNEHLL